MRKLLLEDKVPNILPLKDGGYMFMADVWRPKSLSDSRYIWLPVRFNGKGIPFIEWVDKW